MLDSQNPSNPFAKSPLRLSSLVEPLNNIFNQNSAVKEAFAPMKSAIDNRLQELNNVLQPIMQQPLVQQQPKTIAGIPQQQPQNQMPQQQSKAMVGIPQISQQQAPAADYLKNLTSRYNNMYSFTPVDYDPFGVVSQKQGLYG